ncbi:hypothetical protein D9M68_678500 [compost metagenome]
MRETTTLFGHQITSGNDNLLGFAETLEECKAAAQEMIDDLNEHEPNTELGTFAIYRCEILCPDRETLIRVLNDELSLPEACVVDRHLVATIEG